ncbi:MAG: CoA transferase, partial [Phenylobacterium sp.]|uniref:CoA transferase n=1 Tax=Phenylobacterium sp. TaxID=1871053 RepID=UPI00273751D6
VMARLGLDYETVSKINPKAVYCSISGFGQTGPLSQRAAYAPVAHAFSGFDMMLSRLPDREAPPPDNRVMIADIVAGGLRLLRDPDRAGAPPAQRRRQPRGRGHGRQHDDAGGHADPAGPTRRPVA